MILDAVYKGDPSNAIALLRSVKQLYINKDFDEAIKLGENLIKNLDLEIALKCIREYKEHKNPNEHDIRYIMQLWEEYLKVCSFGDVYYYVASSYMEKGEYYNAIEYFFMADEFLKASNFYNAEEYNRKYETNGIYVRIKLARCLFYLARYEEATIIYKWLDEKEILTKVEKVNIRKMYFNKKKQNLLWD